MQPRPVSLGLIGLAALCALTLPLLLPPTPGAESKFCATGTPESVLGCLSAAFNARDIEAYDRLLAPDFSLRMPRQGPADPGGSWDRAQDLKGVSRLFASQDIRSIQHAVAAFNPPVATGKGTWEISGIVTDLTVLQAAHPDQPLVAHAEGATLRIRRVSSPEPHFEIYEWIEPAP